MVRSRERLGGLLRFYHREACAPQKVDPALIARFRPAMIDCLAPVDRWAPSRLPVVAHRLMVYFKRAEFWHRTGWRCETIGQEHTADHLARLTVATSA